MKRGLRVASLAAVLFAAAAAGFSAGARACPGCKEAAFDTPDQAERRVAAARAYGTTIGLMLLLPAAMVGTIGFSVVRSARKRAAGHV